MTDELIRSLQRDWQSQEYDATHVVRRLRRRRWTPHLVFALEVLGCCLALGVGAWFAWVAAHQSEHRLLMALSAAVLLITVPLLGVATALARRPSLEFLVVYSSVCLAVSLGSLIWMAWRVRAVRAERDACVRLLATLRE